TYHATFSLGQIVRLEDQSKFHQIFTGRVSEVVEHYKDVLVVHVTPLDYEPTNPLAPPPVRLTLSTHVLSLPKHLRFLRWCKKRAKCLRKFKATEPDAIMRSLDDFQKQLDGMDSFGNSAVEFGSEILSTMRVLGLILYTIYALALYILKILRTISVQVPQSVLENNESCNTN
ncbi:hypothetical protein BDR06DRAFT_1061777, partial [Suillus hirtellus]